MKVWLRLVLLLLGVGAFLGLRAQVPTETTSVPTRIAWRSYDAALQEAWRTGKPIYIQFHAHWCPYCRKLAKESYTRPDIEQLLNREFVPVRIVQGSQEQYHVGDKAHDVQNLFGEHGVSAFPTMVFLKSDGRPLAKMVGYLKPEDFYRLLRFIESGSYLRMSYDEYKVSP